MNKKFVNEFYNLFKGMDLDLYVGSREQVRLTLQLKFNRFIPLKYIDRAFKNFIACDLIVDTGKTKEISKQIGLKFFKNTAQKIYVRNTELTNIDDLLKSLYVIFQDFENVTSEVVQKSDIKRLRQLEEDKNIVVSSLLERKTYNYNMDFSDIGLLYCVPRSRVLEFIAILENYDPALAKMKREIKKKEKEAEKKEYIDKRKLILKKCVSLIRRTFELDCMLSVSMKVSSLYNPYEKLKIGSFVANSIDFNENIIIIKNADFCMEFEVNGVNINSESSVIVVAIGHADVDILISSEFQDHLYMLEQFTNIQNKYL